MQNEKACGLSPASLNGLELPRRSAIVTVIIVMTIVMIMTMGADADADGANMNTDDGGVRRACTQQGEGKNRGDKSFHGDSLSRGASSASFADTGVDGSRWYGKPPDRHSFKIVQADTSYSAANTYFPAFPPAGVPELLARVTI
jgi:hypothetical protein